MKFLANENFPVPSVRALQSLGVGVASISETTPGISDKEVIQIAQKENPIILTFDKDYGELIFRHSVHNPSAVVFFRFKGTTLVYAGDLLNEIIKENKI